MRKSVKIAGLAVIALALGTPVFATCVAPVTFVFSGYIYRSDNVAAFTPHCGPTFTEYPCAAAPSLSGAVKGSFWTIGQGNTLPVAGMDNGTQPALGYWLYPGAATTSPAGNFYAHYALGTWAGDLRIDGCPDLLPGPCMAIVLSDQDASGKGYFAVLTDQADGLDNYDFGPLGDVVLKPAPKPKVVGSQRISSSQVDLQVALSSVPSDAASGVYSTGCGAGVITGFRVYRQNVPRNAPGPTSRDLSSNWVLAGSSGTPGGSASFSVTCAGDEDVYLTAGLVFDSGFTLALGSENGTKVQCGPTLVDPVKPILPPRRGKPAEVRPRDDRGSR